jgi:hypothetical protein
LAGEAGADFFDAGFADFFAVAPTLFRTARTTFPGVAVAREARFVACFVDFLVAAFARFCTLSPSRFTVRGSLSSRVPT